MLTKSLAALGVVVGVSSIGATSASAEDLTLCWAAWDPANALVELSKDFEAKSGHKMSFEFVPWPNFADRMLNELNSQGKLCDLMIGDSQWIGGAAENGHYVKLNDFFEKEGITMDDFISATVTGYSEWPKNTPNYWALPAYADVVGWTYRKDWFERPELQKEFMDKHGYKLDAPKTLEQLKQIGEFFQGREIDGKTVYGAAIYTERGSEGITMGVTNALYNYGFKYENPDKPYDLEGFVNSPEAVAGLEYYKALYDCCTPPGSSDWYMSEDIDAYKSGQVAMQMNFAFIWPGVEADPNVGGGKSGYFTNPAGPGGHFAQLGGQGISVVSYSDKQDAALEYIKWFAQPDIQQKWWDAGGAPAFKAVVDAPDFVSSQPFAQTFLDSMAIVKDFWAEPAYADLLLAMQSRIHNYVIAEQGTAKEALDGLVKDWDEVFEDEGKK
ncbi:ABC transporter substrate-binding protein [uncultured Cohaesibacter sp.]|uniref:ABC transporter substrate-binding protein n=1 Tax=uncultured Cohaesibacter sp. TaxID=1002546 RepID=UPI00374A8F72